MPVIVTMPIAPDRLGCEGWIYSEPPSFEILDPCRVGNIVTGEIKLPMVKINPGITHSTLSAAALEWTYASGHKLQFDGAYGKAGNAITHMDGELTVSAPDGELHYIHVAGNAFTRADGVLCILCEKEVAFESNTQYDGEYWERVIGFEVEHGNAYITQGTIVLNNGMTFEGRITSIELSSSPTIRATGKITSGEKFEGVLVNWVRIHGKMNVHFSSTMVEFNGLFISGNPGHGYLCERYGIIGQYYSFEFLGDETSPDSPQKLNGYVRVYASGVIKYLNGVSSGPQWQLRIWRSTTNTLVGEWQLRRFMGTVYYRDGRIYDGELDEHNKPVCGTMREKNGTVA